MMTDSSVAGATPLALALESVKTKMDSLKTADTYQNCRQRFVILLSDGADRSTAVRRQRHGPHLYKAQLASGGPGQGPGRRRLQLFVVGFGSNLPHREEHPELDGLLWGTTTRCHEQLRQDGPRRLAFGADPCADASTTGTCDDSSTQCSHVHDPGNTPLKRLSPHRRMPRNSRRACGDAINYIRGRPTTPSRSRRCASSRIGRREYLYECPSTREQRPPCGRAHSQVLKS
jgi:hypothetical protein